MVAYNSGVESYRRRVPPQLNVREVEEVRVLYALPCTEGQVRVRALEHGDAAAYARGSRDGQVALTFERPVVEFRTGITSGAKK